MTDTANQQFPDGTYAWGCVECGHYRLSHSENKDPNRKLESENPCAGCDGEWRRFTVSLYYGVPKEHWWAENGERKFADGYPKPVEEVVDLDAVREAIKERRKAINWGPDPWG